MGDNFNLLSPQDRGGDRRDWDARLRRLRLHVRADLDHGAAQWDAAGDESLQVQSQQDGELHKQRSDKSLLMDGCCWRQTFKNNVGDKFNLKLKCFWKGIENSW